MGALQISGLTKRFKAETVLDDVSLQVPDGETLILFGPSGAGKTVLLRCIAGVVDPDEGQVFIGEEDVTSVPPEGRDVGMAFQNFALFPHLSAYDNIASPLVAHRFAKERIRDTVDGVARLLKIDHVLSHAPRALSNGQKQRTALARALAGQPGVLLLDDPLRNVDAKLRFEMRLELPRLLAEQGTTVVYVTQDYKEAMALADKIAILSDGRIMQVGRPDDIYLRPADLRIAEQFGDPSINLLDVCPEADGSGVYVRISDKRVALEAGYENTVGQKVVLGIRPESIRFSQMLDAIDVTIEADTPLNEKIVTLTTTKRGREILVSRPAESSGPGSKTTAIEIDASAAILFNRETGKRIAPDMASAAGGTRQVA
ncbi:MAG: ABC transporter ATP-binding protein [Pseudomonadota bacterium]